jgi:hypothetical protein
MIFDPKVGLQIVIHRRENREEGCKQLVNVRRSHSIMDKAFATNVCREQNVKTREKKCSICHNYSDTRCIEQGMYSNVFQNEMRVEWMDVWTLFAVLIRALPSYTSRHVPEAPNPCSGHILLPIRQSGNSSRPSSAFRLVWTCYVSRREYQCHAFGD